MPSPKNSLLLLLCLALAGTSALCWYQYRQLTSLRVTIADNAQVTAKANSRITDLESKLSAKSQTAPDDTSDAAGENGARPDMARGRARWQDRAEAFRKVTSSPEFQKLVQIRTAGAIDNRYASLFKQLQLPPQALQQFKSLLAEKQSALQDVLASARSEGMSGPANRAAVQSMIQQTQAELDANIQQAIGSDAYAQYQQYEHTLPQQATVSELAQRLSYTSTPLTSDQTQQLVNILASANGQNQNTAGMNNRTVMALAMGGQVPPANVSTAAVQQAQSVLSSDQLAALQQLQAEQEAQKQMQQMMRQAFRGNTTPAAPASAPASGTATTTKTGG